MDWGWLKSRLTGLEAGYHAELPSLDARAMAITAQQQPLLIGASIGASTPTASTAVQNYKLPLLLFVHGCLRFLKSWRRASAWSRRHTAAWQFMQCHNSVCTENTVRPTKIQKCILRAADPTPIQYINLIIYFNNLHRGGATISSCAAAWGATALCTGRSSAHRQLFKKRQHP
jgi:hypothetical protein